MGNCSSSFCRASFHVGWISPRVSRAALSEDAASVSRYARRDSLPEDLRIDAETDDGVVMAIAHRDRPIYGIQFHPESYGTEGGDKLIANFLKEVRQ